MNRNIALAVVAVLALIGLGLFVVGKNAVAPVVTPVATSTATTSEPMTTTNIASSTVDLDALTWKEYRNEELGISMLYPVELLERPFSMAPGETGKVFHGVLKFPPSTDVWIGSLSTDYTEGKDGNWGANLGFEKTGNDYSIIYLFGFTRTVNPQTLWSFNKGQSTALVLFANDFSSDIRDNYYAPDLLVVANLHGKKFPGLGFELMGNNITPESKEVDIVKSMVSSITFLQER